MPGNEEQDHERLHVTAGCSHLINVEFGIGAALTIYLSVHPTCQGQHHHKSHIGKVLAFVMTGFAPLDNDFEKGGTALKILIKRAGAMVEAKRNTYKRVYKNDGSGTFHYPKLPNNILRKKGNDYFESREITGSNEGTPRLFNGSHYLQGEALWDAVLRVYEEYSLETLAKLYVHHGQIVNAIIQCKGGDEFVTESKSLHCGVRSVMAQKPNVTAEYWTSGAHEEGHEYNPSDHLSPNLLDAFNHYVDDDHLDSDYFKEAYEKLDLDNIDNPMD